MAILKRKFFGVALLIVGLGGCGRSGPTRIEISGTVTYDGQPIPVGRISFEPTLAAGQQAATGYAVIRDGWYRTAPGHGASPGPYTVRIYGGDGKLSQPAVNFDPEEPPADSVRLGKLLFSEYEAPVDLPEKDTKRDFDVPREAGSQPKR